MKALQFVLIICAVLVACGCSQSPRERVEMTLRKNGVEPLRSEAARLYKDVFAGSAPAEFVAIKPSLWPGSFRLLSPDHVGAYPDGFALALVIEGDSESGVYVVPQEMETRPSDKDKARFERLDEGIYWYSFRR